MVTKAVREKAIADEKGTILQFLGEQWNRLIQDGAISEREDYVDGDTRRLVKNFILKTDEGNVDITFEFKIHTRPWFVHEVDEEK